MCPFRRPRDLAGVALSSYCCYMTCYILLQVAQSVISKLLTLASINDEEDIKVGLRTLLFPLQNPWTFELHWFRVLFLIGDKYAVVVFTSYNLLLICNFHMQMYINCPGGSTYSIMAIYDAMQWVSTSFDSRLLTWCAVVSRTVYSSRPETIWFSWCEIEAEGMKVFNIVRPTQSYPWNRCMLHLSL